MSHNDPLHWVVEGLSMRLVIIYNVICGAKPFDHKLDVVGDVRVSSLTHAYPEHPVIKSILECDVSSGLFLARFVLIVSCIVGFPASSYME